MRMSWPRTDRSALAARIERVWYSSEPPPWGLRALVSVYRMLRFLHRAPFRLGLRKPIRLRQPLIVVGNLVAGGSGKTPLVIALAKALSERGFAPGVISRGYGGSAREVMLLDARSTPAVVGDEPCLVRERSGVPVAIGRDRAASAALLAAQGVDVVIADDGLQNPALAGDIEICVVDGQRRFGNGRLLPAGPLREPPDRLARVDFRVINGGDAGPDEVSMRLVGERALALLGDAARPLTDFAGQRVHAVAGIGHPPRFFASLSAHGIEVIEHAFADHHDFSAQDICFDDHLPVLMTEKDAIKCRRFAQSRHWFLPVDAELPEQFLEEVARMLRAR